MKLLLRTLLLLLAGLVFFFFAGLFATWAPDKTVQELQPLWAQPPSRFVAMDGLTVHLRDEGPRDDPAPIVLLHGTSDSLHTWDGWTEVLRKDRRVVRFDLPGFGLTGPNRAGDYSIDAYVRFVVSVLDQLGIGQCVLGGNSLGGQIAWQTALAVPARVKQLILVDAGGYPAPPQAVPLAFRLARIGLFGSALEHVLPRGLVQSSVINVYGDSARVTPQLVDRYYDMALRTGNRRALAQILAVTPVDGSARIRELVLPTLVMWGARDRLIPVQSGQRFARDIAGARLIVFDDLGHLPHQEDPVRTVIEVRRFLGLMP